MSTPSLGTIRAKAPDPTGLPLEALTIEQIGAATRSAQIDGVGVGGITGFLGAFMSHRVFRQSKNVSLLSGLLTASVAGYIFTQTSLKVHLAKASANSTILRDSLQAKDKAQAEAFWANEREGGAVGSGLEALSDKYASTRGDH